MPTSLQVVSSSRCMDITLENARLWQVFYTCPQSSRKIFDRAWGTELGEHAPRSSPLEAMAVSSSVQGEETGDPEISTVPCSTLMDHRQGFQGLRYKAFRTPACHHGQPRLDGREALLLAPPSDLTSIFFSLRLGAMVSHCSDPIAYHHSLTSFLSLANIIYL